MSEINHIISWLIEKTAHSVNCEAQKINIGNLTEYIQMQQKDGTTDPLKIRLCHEPQSALAENQIFNFCIDRDKEYKTQFIKRIEYTPFYYSNIISKKYSVKLVDFYQWNAPIMIIRIFIIEHDKAEFELQLGHADIQIFKKNKTTINYEDWVVKTSSEVSWNGQEKYYVFKPTVNDRKQAIVFFTFQKQNQNPKDYSQKYIISLLTKLEVRSREKHICKHLVIKEPSAKQELDDIWMQQKIYTPELNLDSAILQNPAANDITLSWAIEIALIFGWQPIIDTIINMLRTKLVEESCTNRLIFWYHFLELWLNPNLKSKKLNDTLVKQSRVRDDHITDDTFYFLVNYQEENAKKKTSLLGDNLIYCAYFTNKISEERIVSFLQYWWEIYSYPLFIKKFYFELEHHPEKVFLIYLLALKYQLPWADILFKYSKGFKDHIFFRIIAFIRKRLQLEFESPGMLNIFPGSKWDNNLKRIYYTKESLAISFSKFGSKKYLTIKQHDQMLFKIDREVRVSFDTQKNHLRIYPNVADIPVNTILKTIVNIKVGDYSLALPILWRQGELIFNGLRFRWIFKKERFQFTVNRQRKIDFFWFNEEKYKFSNSFRNKFYLNRERNIPIIQLRLLDDLGRYIHRRTAKSHRSLSISGYCLDRYGLFLDHFNYSYNNKNHPASIDRSGMVWQSIKLPSSCLSLHIQIKNYREQLNLMVFPEGFYEYILQFSPLHWNSDFVILIDRELLSQRQKIIDIFEDDFLFRPNFFVYDDMYLPPSRLRVIRIRNTHSAIKTKIDKGISLHPILELGIGRRLDNIKALHNYITQPFKKLILKKFSA